MIDAATFANRLKACLPCPHPKHIAVAVSGGADSLCLLTLTAQWARQHNIPITALTVDHGLRLESSAEAEGISKQLCEQGINHHILKWNHEGIQGGLQQKARDARYQLLLDYCKTNHIPCLLVGHHQNDQIETLMQRLSHHSGRIGLAGIPDRRYKRGICISRPLLTFTREDIRQTLKSTWIEDPSNTNESFTRIKIRNKLFPADVAPLLSLQKKAAHYRRDLQSRASRFHVESMKLYPSGFVEMDADEFLLQGSDLQLFILGEVLKFVSGNPYSALHAKLLEKLIEPNFSKITIDGCLLEKQKNVVRIVREMHKRPCAQKIDTHRFVWDQRFMVDLAKHIDLNDLHIGYLKDRWTDFKDHDKLMALPSAARQALPGIWRKEQLIHVPFLDYDGDSHARLIYFPELEINSSHFMNY